MTESILPESPNDAVRKMIELAQECLALAETESDMITRNDMVQFAVNEQTKLSAFEYYTEAAEEFQNRFVEFQGKVNPDLITELQKVQLALKEQSDANNLRLEQIEGLIKKDA